MAAPHGSHKSIRIPVFVMLPLDTVSISGHLNKPRAMLASLMALKSAGAEGVMVDVWWGLVEKDEPLNYNWEGYAELIKMVEKLGLKLQAVMSSLVATAAATGNHNWGRGGPHDAGQYNQFPEDTGFFRKEGTWNSEYGRFFLEWYSGKLLDHGESILTSAETIFQGTGAKLSGKVAGIHWHYNTRSHAPELTAGYYNTRHHDGYLPIARMLSKHGVVLNFTCMEMRDGEQPGEANCSPEGLVRQVKMATKTARGELAGENALERYDRGAFSQVLETSRSYSGSGLSAFTYLRLNKRLFEAENWRNLVEFVKSMSEGGKSTRLPESDRIGTDLYVGFVKQSNMRKLIEVEAALV